MEGWKDVAVLSESDVPAVSAIFWRQTTEIGASLGLADDGSDITRPSDTAAFTFIGNGICVSGKRSTTFKLA